VLDLARTDGSIGAVFEKAQRVALYIERELADLVEKEHTFTGDVDQPRLVVSRAAECSRDVAEQLGARELAGEFGTVLRHEWMGSCCGSPATEPRTLGDTLLDVAEWFPRSTAGAC
jgi:hypothetical protein